MLAVSILGKKFSCDAQIEVRTRVFVDNYLAWLVRQKVLIYTSLRCCRYTLILRHIDFMIYVQVGLINFQDFGVWFA